MKNNYVIVEVWTRAHHKRRHHVNNSNISISGGDGDKLIGMCKIPLDIFHQSLNEEEVARWVSVDEDVSDTLK